MGTGPAGRIDPGDPHAGPDGESARPGAVADDAPNDLVTRHDGQAGRRGPALDLVELRVADTAGAHPDEGLPGARAGLGKIDEPQGLFLPGQVRNPLQDHRFHGSVPPLSPAGAGFGL